MSQLFNTSGDDIIALYRSLGWSQADLDRLRSGDTSMLAKPARQPAPDAAAAFRLDALRMTLALAVPQWVRQHATADPDQLDDRWRACRDALISADEDGPGGPTDLMFGDRAPGRAGWMCNRLAEGIAVTLLRIGADRDAQRLPVEALGLRFTLHPDGRCTVAAIPAAGGDR